MNTLILPTFAIYLVASIGFTIWVARTLQKNGRRFLLDTFQGDDSLTDSVNHLLVVGFYLINLGFVFHAWRFGTRPENISEIIDFLTGKIGLVLVILGVMHFFNLFLFNHLRQRARISTWAPAVIPQERIDPTATEQA